MVLSRSWGQIGCQGGQFSWVSGRLALVGIGDQLFKRVKQLSKKDSKLKEVHREFLFHYWVFNELWVLMRGRTTGSQPISLCWYVIKDVIEMNVLVFNAFLMVCLDCKCQLIANSDNLRLLPLLPLQLLDSLNTFSDYGSILGALQHFDEFE